MLVPSSSFKSVWLGCVLFSISSIAIAGGSVTASAPDTMPTRAALMTASATASTSSTATFNPALLMVDHGGPVLTAQKIEVIYWGTSWSNPAFAGDIISGMDQFFTAFQGSAYQSLANEYLRGGTPSTTYLGHVFDSSPALPDEAFFDGTAPIEEVCKLTNDNPDPTVLYFVYTDQPLYHQPQYCAYHNGGTCSNGKVVQVAYVPNLYVADPYDPASNTNWACSIHDLSSGHSPGLSALAAASAHEMMEAITDPQINAWYDDTPEQAEIGDPCAYTFGNTDGGLVPLSDGSKWKLQLLWSNLAYTTATGTPAGYPAFAQHGAPGCASSGAVIIKENIAGSGEGAIVTPTRQCTTYAGCVDFVLPGTTLKFTALPASGSKLDQWLGCDSVNGLVCTVTANKAKSVTALFSAMPIELLTISVNSPIHGLSGVVSQFGMCRTHCTASVAQGSHIVLTAVPYGGQHFVGWSGACAGTNATCVVDMSVARNVGAAFR